MLLLFNGGHSVDVNRFRRGHGRRTVDNVARDWDTVQVTALGAGVSRARVRLGAARHG
jgi:hypothetical protein